MDEVNDLTGISNGLFTLQWAVVFKRRSLRMTIGIARWNVKIVEHSSLINEFLWNGHRIWQLVQESGNDVSPRLLPLMKMQSLHCFLRRLLSSKARPLMTPGPS